MKTEKCHPKSLNPQVPKSPNPQIPKSPNPSSAGFTLVELLVVIVIIGVLIGLMVGAAGPVRNMVRNWRMRSEIVQLGLALERVRNDLGGGIQYPPDSADLNDSSNATTTNDLQQFFRRAFPRAILSFSGGTVSALNAPGGSALGTAILPSNPAEALVFWLGGMRDTNGNFVGFSSNQINPFDTTTGSSRIGPFFDFDRSRVAPGSANTSSNFGTNPWNWVYYPQNDLTLPTGGPTAGTITPQPYTYFKAVANQYAPAFKSGYNWNYAMPFVDAAATIQAQSSSSGAVVWVNPQSYQLLCPGLDGLYGNVTGASTAAATADGNPPLWPAGSWSGTSVSASGNNYGVNTRDDITNFVKGGTLASDIP
jgi:prepilin-type N-terminal cleavage/methylation domain-containing protein